MKIEDRIKSTVEQQLAKRPSHAGAFDNVQRRFRRGQRIRVAAATAGAALAVAGAVVVVPKLGDNSTTKLPVASAPPSAQSPTPTPTVTPPAFTSCVPNCRLVERRNVAAPVANATGVTFDGESLWIVAGGDGQTTSLIEVDPTSGALGRRYHFQNLVETAGTSVQGITWDGETLWISVAGNTNKIVRIDPNDGSIAQTYSSPAVLGPTDLDFDGTNVWMSSGTGEVFVLDPTNGGVLRTFAAWPKEHRDSGIAVRPGEVWIGNLFGDSSGGGVAIQDPKSGSLIDTVVGADGKAMRRAWGSMCFVGDQLVLLDRFGITFFEVGSSK